MVETNSCKTQIPYSFFDQMNLQVGTILSVEEVESSQKLLKITVGLGETGEKIILSGIKGIIEPKDLVGVQVLVLVNLEPKKMMGLESQGMILMADYCKDGKETPVLMIPQKKVPDGTRVI